MRRHPLAALLACALVLGLGAGTVALASGGGSAAPAKPRERAAVAHQHRGGGMHQMVAAMVLRSLSDRLGVEPARLRAAGAAVAREQWARRKAGSKPDLAALKQELAASLGDKLGLPADKVLEAVRAELEQRLGQAAAFGMVSEKGRALALACFDAPAACDLRALRREVRLPSRHPRHG